MSELVPNDLLRDARVIRGLTQEELAKLLGTTSLNVGRWERGETFPRQYFMKVLCTFFQMQPEALGFPAKKPKAPLSQIGLFDPAIPIPSSTHVIGRDNEFASLKQQLLADNYAMVTALNGLPGVGKTTLAIMLAHDPDVLAHFCDGILWSGLGPHPDVQGSLSRWGSLVGLSARERDMLKGVEAWANAICTAIGKRTMLLVIDDVWQLEEVLALKVGGPHCRYLVTTRFPAIANALTIDGVTALQELGEAESMELLRTLAPAVMEHEEQRAQHLVQLVGGLPLALTLMGNYLRIQSYSGSTRRIHAALERLSDAEVRLQLSEPLGPGERHPSLPAESSLSLRAMIAVTDQHLGEQARAALYALAVFPAKPQSFSEEAALTVACSPADALDELIDAGLLESSGVERYMLHQTISDYARAQLQGRSSYKRLIAYCSAFIKRHAKEYEELERESAMLLAALDATYELSMGAALAQSTCELAPFLLSRGVYALVEQYLQRAREAAVEMDDADGLTMILLYLGETAQKQGNYAQSEEYYQEGLRLARESEDHKQVCALLTNLGWVTLKRGGYKKAEAYLQEGLTLARQIQDPERVSALLEMLGSVTASLGEYIRSEAYMQEGLMLARQAGDHERICTILINLGVTEGGWGNNAQAEAYLQEGLTIARRIGHREWIALLLINLGGVAIEEEDYLEAEAYLQEGLMIVRQIEHREWISALLANLALIAKKQRNYGLAEMYLQESLTLARQLDRPQITANAMYEYGNLCLDLKHLEDAEAHFSEMLTLVPEKDQELLALAHYGLARTAAFRGNIQGALEFGKASLGALEMIKHHKAQEVKQWLETFI